MIQAIGTEQLGCAGVRQNEASGEYEIAIAAFLAKDFSFLLARQFFGIRHPLPLPNIISRMLSAGMPLKNLNLDCGALHGASGEPPRRLKPKFAPAGGTRGSRHTRDKPTESLTDYPSMDARIPRAGGRNAAAPNGRRAQRSGASAVFGRRLPPA